MTDINDLVQKFWMTSSDEAVEASFFALRRLLEIFYACLYFLEVCFDIISIFADAVDLADKNLQNPNPSAQLLDDRIRAKFRILSVGYRQMVDQSFFESKDLGDILRFLPGVVVQERLSMQGLADLYRIKPDSLKRLIDSTIEPLRLSSHDPYPRYLFFFYFFYFFFSVYL